MRVERLYHKEPGKSFVAGITINDTHGPDETRLIVTVTDLEVPSLTQRLARELLLPKQNLEKLLRRAGATIETLARAACVRPETIRDRLADTGLWSEIYLGNETSGS